MFLFIFKIILFSVKKTKAKWEIEIKSIKSCELQSGGLTLKTSPSNFKKTKGRTSFCFPFSDLRLNQKLLLRISELIPSN